MSIWPRAAMIEEMGWMLPDGEDVLQRWQESLDDLERQARAALKLATAQADTAYAATPADAGSGAQAWAVPADLGPLPDSLAVRARYVVELQQRAAAMMAASRDDVEREMTQLARPGRQIQPVYVDVTG